MSTIIIVIAVIALAVLLVIRSKQGKENSSAPKKTKPNSTTARKTTKKKAEPTRTESIKPKVDINNVMSQVDVLISDKQYGKAEGIIHQALNKDSNLHELYSRLLDIYQLQDDEFAIKKLLDMVQNLNLNEVYQQLYNDYEAFKDQKNNIVRHDNQSSPNNLSILSPGTVEYTPEEKIPPKTSQDPNHLQNEVKATDSSQLNTLNFDQLITNNNLPESTASALDLTLDQPKAIQTESALVLNTPEEPILEFKIDENPSHQDLEFTFEKSTIETESTLSTPLEFNLDPISDDRTDLTLEFKHEERSIDQSNQSSLNVLDFNTALDSEPEAVPPTPHHTIYADINDPIAQAFPALAYVDPIELDIDLAEQYINLGEYQAAQQLLKYENAQITPTQSERVQLLLQKIAS